MNSKEIKAQADKIYEHVTGLVGTPETFETFENWIRNKIGLPIRSDFGQRPKSHIDFGSNQILHKDGSIPIGKALNSAKAGELVTVALDFNLGVDFDDLDL